MQFYCCPANLLMVYVLASTGCYGAAMFMICIDIIWECLSWLLLLWHFDCCMGVDVIVIKYEYSYVVGVCI